MLNSKNYLIFNSVELVCRIRYEKDNSMGCGKDWKLTSIHTVVANESNILSLSNKLFKEFMTQKSHECRQRNMKGQLPLHILLSNQKCGRDTSLEDHMSSDIFHDDKNILSHKGSAMKHLLNEFPESASIPDSSRILPLFLGIQAGISWYQGINTIIEKAPQTLAVQHPYCKLYPFMFAASIKGSRSDLTTIFCLLQERPDLCKIYHYSRSRKRIVNDQMRPIQWKRKDCEKLNTTNHRKMRKGNLHSYSQVSILENL